MDNMPEPRIILRIDISPLAARRLPAICGRYGCTQLSALSRLVEWYAKLPDGLRYALVGVHGGDPKSARAILQHMIDNKS